MRKIIMYILFFISCLFIGVQSVYASNSARDGWCKYSEDGSSNKIYNVVVTDNMYDNILLWVYEGNYDSHNGSRSDIELAENSLSYFYDSGKKKVKCPNNIYMYSTSTYNETYAFPYKPDECNGVVSCKKYNLETTVPFKTVNRGYCVYDGCTGNGNGTAKIEISMDDDGKITASKNGKKETLKYAGDTDAIADNIIYNGNCPAHAVYENKFNNQIWIGNNLDTIKTKSKYDTASEYYVCNLNEEVSTIHNRDEEREEREEEAEKAENETVESEKHDIPYNPENWKICNGVSANSKAVLKVLRFIGYILQLAFILVPVILIVIGSIDFVKAVAAGKDDDIKKAQSTFVKRIIAAVIVFLVPYIIGVLLNVLNQTKSNCYTCVMNPSSCNVGD